MLPIVGLLCVLFLVFGGYLWSGGKVGVIIKALPYELTMIGGAALGAFLISNSSTAIKHCGHGMKMAFKGAQFSREHYIELLSLLFALTKLMKTKGAVAVEAHVENPKDSTIFQAYPTVLNNHHSLHMITDALRLITMDVTNPHEVGDMLEAQIEKLKHEELHAAHSIQTLSDGLPALGIVAAVLGIIKTMGSISEPPEILGKMIGGALTGTFLGVYLSYCYAAPFAAKITEVVNEEMQYYTVIKDVLVSYLSGKAAQIAVEMARGQIPTHLQPSFYDVEEALNNVEVPT